MTCDDTHLKTSTAVLPILAQKTYPQVSKNLVLFVKVVIFIYDQLWVRCEQYIRSRSSKSYQNRLLAQSLTTR